MASTSTSTSTCSTATIILACITTVSAVIDNTLQDRFNIQVDQTTIQLTGALEHMWGKWNGEVYDPVSGKMFGIPDEYDNWAIIDPKTNAMDTTKSSGAPRGGDKWCGGCYDPDVKKIYAMPTRYGAVGIFDPATNASDVTAISGFDNQTRKWKRCVYSPLTKKIYGFPDTADGVLIIDPQTNASDITAMGGLNHSNLTESTKWQGGAYYPPLDLLIGCPGHAHAILIADVATNATDYSTMDGFGDADSKWYDGAYYESTAKIYCIPATSNSILIIDPRYNVTDITAMVVETHIVVGAFHSRWGHATIDPDTGILYGMPASGHITKGNNTKSILIADVANNLTSEIEVINWSRNQFGYGQAEYDPITKRMYCMPYSADDVMIIGPPLTLSPTPLSLSPTFSTPTSPPTAPPSIGPTPFPTWSPTDFPTNNNPTTSPTSPPTKSFPTESPTTSPTSWPTWAPSQFPTSSSPSTLPTKTPTIMPTGLPTIYPTSVPTCPQGTGTGMGMGMGVGMGMGTENNSPTLCVPHGPPTSPPPTDTPPPVHVYTASPTVSPISINLEFDAAKGDSEKTTRAAVIGASSVVILLLVVAAVVIISFVVSRKKAAEAGRDMIAFENPMYDDITQTQINPGIEDFYDSNNIMEQNFYEEADDVSEDITNATSGYMDVPAANPNNSGSGYMDVKPQTSNAPTGYMDAAPTFDDFDSEEEDV